MSPVRNLLEVCIALLCMLIVCCHAEDEGQIPTVNMTNKVEEPASLAQSIHDTFVFIDKIYSIIIVLLNGYQAVLFVVAVISKPKTYSKHEPQSIAVVICARNEEQVIGDLLDCLNKQNYPKDLVKIFVCADHCTDNTAGIVRDAGGIVYERSENNGIGKGYALRFLLRQIAEDFPAGFDSYLFFDADNLVPPDFLQKMNDALRSGYDVVSSYRNSKNYGDSFVSASLSLWFIAESRFLFQPRSVIGQSAMVGGTGFIVAKHVIDELGDWHYLTITEDIEFTIDQLIKGRKIGYCADAQVFDEQPVSFRVSLTQRLRWAKGFLQVLSLYGKKIVECIFQGSFACYDLLMINIMCYVVSICAAVIPILIGTSGYFAGMDLYTVVSPLLTAIVKSTISFVIAGLVITICEWKNIHAKPWKKLYYALYIPLFMFSYLPLVIMALFKDVEWKRIPHTVSKSSVSQRMSEEQLPIELRSSEKFEVD